MKTSYKPSLGIILYALSTLLTLPIFWGSIYLYKQYNHLVEVEERILFLQKKQQKRKESQYLEEKILTQIQTPSDKEDLFTTLSSKPLLGAQQQKWKMFLAQTSSKNPSEPILEDNILHFTLKSSLKGTLFEEKEWKQEKPIYMNEEDLQNTLSLLEGKSDGLQVVITSFSLEKKTFPELQERAFAIQMELLTRQKNL